MYDGDNVMAKAWHTSHAEPSLKLIAVHPGRGDGTTMTLCIVTRLACETIMRVQLRKHDGNLREQATGPRVVFLSKALRETQRESSVAYHEGLYRHI